MSHGGFVPADASGVVSGGTGFLSTYWREMAGRWSGCYIKSNIGVKAESGETSWLGLYIDDGVYEAHLKAA